MHRDEQIGVHPIGQVGPDTQSRGVVRRPGEYDVDAPDDEVGLESLRDIEIEMLLHQTIGPDRSRVHLTAVTGINDHLRGPQRCAFPDNGLVSTG